jgi:hypothetical protein
MKRTDYTEFDYSESVESVRFIRVIRADSLMLPVR